MIIGMTASVCSFIYTCLVYVIYLKKTKLKNDENAIYSFMIFSNICGLVLEFLIYLFATFPNVESSFIPIIVERVYFVYLFSWLYLFTIYIYIISFERKKYNYSIVSNLKIVLLLWIIYLIFTCLILYLPVEHIITKIGTYSTGPACYVLYALAVIAVITSIVFVIINRDKMELKKKLPIISLIACIVLMLIIRVFIPEALFISTMFAFVTILTYFTIENPDIRMAKDLAFANVQLKNRKDNTIDVLNDLSSKLQNSLSKLETFGYKKKDTSNVEEMAKDLKYIKKYCINFNGLIDISKINSGNLTINEDEYETNNFISEIERLINKNIKIKRGKLPSILYGDKKKIEQIIVLMYKYLSKKGNIDVELDYVVVGRFCKLKFNFISNDVDISDYIYKTKEYSVKDNNFIFYENKDNIEYDKIMSLVSFSGGNMKIIRGKYKNRLVLSINQRVRSPYKLIEEKDDNRNIKVRYFDLSSKRILIVDDGINDIREMFFFVKTL